MHQCLLEVQQRLWMLTQTQRERKQPWSPASVSSVRWWRLWLPAAASMVMQESVMSLQWARSNLWSWGMWRCSNLSVDSLISRPDRRSVSMFLSLLRDDSRPAHKCTPCQMTALRQATTSKLSADTQSSWTWRYVHITFCNARSSGHCQWKVHVKVRLRLSWSKLSCSQQFSGS